MSNVISWPNNVNQFVSDQSNITIGEGGFVEDQSSTGHQERYLTQTVSQKKYNVVMFFNFSEKDEKGLSEFDRFEKWYEFKHKRGVVPFEFPSISKFNIDSTSNRTYEYARYRITSPLQVSKSGLDMQISMTWTEVYSGIQTLAKIKEPEWIGLYAENGKVTLKMSGDPEDVPLHDSYIVSVSRNGEIYDELPVDLITAKGSEVYIKIQKLESKKQYFIKVKDVKTSAEKITALYVR